MNEWIERMVNGLFEKIEETEEVRALRDEVLSDCEERCEDLLAAGESEAEARKKVAESLAGMEDMLSGYRRKKTEFPPKLCGFEIEGAERLSIVTKKADIVMIPSTDGAFHMNYSGRNRNIRAANEGDTLNVWLEPILDVTTEESEPECGGILRRGLNAVKRMLSDRLEETADYVGVLTVRVPRGCFRALKLRTDSGDITVDACGAAEADLAAASGDVSFTAAEDAPVMRVKLFSDSGDLSADCAAAELDAHAESGDIKLSGPCEEMRARSVSGDIKVNGVQKTITARSVSGDVFVQTDSGAFRRAELESVSGDIRFMYESCLPLHIEAFSTSGDTHILRSSFSAEESALLRAKTVSGDICVN